MKIALLAATMMLTIGLGATAQAYDPRVPMSPSARAASTWSSPPNGAGPVQRTQLLCFWHEFNNSSFGTSGHCPVNDSHAYPGVGCSCSHTQEHRRIEHWGVVVEVDRDDEPMAPLH